MKNTTITRNTPTRPDKVAFYKSLVAFYNSTTENSAITLNAEQKRAVAAIEEFENGNTHLHYNYTPTAIDASVVKNLTPMHHRKANLYRILVAFFDASLAIVKDTTEEESKEECYLALATLVGTAMNSCSDLKAIVLAPIAVVVTEKAEKAEQVVNAPKKRYSVSVHATYVFDKTVEASSAEEAEEMVYKMAQNADDSEWEFVEFEDKGTTYDVEDID